MNDDRPKPPARHVHRAPVSKISRADAVIRTTSVALLVAVMIFAGLTLQMAAGGDPALGSRVAGANAPAPTRSSSSPAPTSASEPAAAQPPPFRVAQVPPQPAPVQTSVS